VCFFLGSDFLIIDVVHFTHGKTITDQIVEIIPDESIKIEPADSKLKTYPFDQLEKMNQVEVKFKSRTVVTLLALGAGLPSLFTFGIPVLSGWGKYITVIISQQQVF